MRIVPPSCRLLADAASPLAGLLLLSLAAGSAAAQDSTAGTESSAPPPAVASSGGGGGARHWGRFALGFVSSIAIHELGHVVASYAVGGKPTFGFDKGRPTIFSGIDERRDPRKQFIFSSAGLTVQTVLDEALLDVPHRGGGAFERGLLAGGLATVAFYVTVGRNAAVSDVTRMAATSSLSRTQVSLLYGGVAALHGVRIVRRGYVGHFFVAPAADGSLRVGLRGTPGTTQTAGR